MFNFAATCSAAVLQGHSTVGETQKTDPETGTGSCKKAHGPRGTGMTSLFSRLGTTSSQVLSVLKGRRSQERINMKGLALITAVISKFGPSIIFPHFFVLFFNLLETRSRTGL